ncbi:unnamed protein product [Echinostoma caproni]|uniref:TraB domain-containing protein n=1 Tax=Echinostoma caproni TaxID=27848 RepID=A0A183ARA2_9TREM|nr:unnamed protein product [Echinostoma caproni]
MAGEHPELVRILVDERDMYLAKSIWSVTGMPYFSKLNNSKTQSASLSENEGPVGDSTDMVRQRTTTVNAEHNTDAEGATEHSVTGNADSPADLNPHIPSCCPYWPSPSVLPRVVVAVVGIGHVSGIKKHWASAEYIDQRALTT